MRGGRAGDPGRSRRDRARLPDPDGVARSASCSLSAVRFPTHPSTRRSTSRRRPSRSSATETCARSGSTGPALLRERHRLALPLLPLAFSTLASGRRRRRLQLERLGARHPHGRAQDRLLPLAGEVALPPGRLPRRPPVGRRLEAGPSPARSVPASASTGARRRAPTPTSRTRRSSESRSGRSTGSMPRCCTRRRASTRTGRSRPFPTSSQGSCSPSPACSPTSTWPRPSMPSACCPEQRLVVVGEGPGRAALEASLPGNVRLLGEVSDARLRWLYASCAGLVAASREDFGLTPVEAAAFGKPVAALRWGGYLDTVVPDVTGVFFERPDAWRDRGRRAASSSGASGTRRGDPGACGDVLRGTLRRAARDSSSRSRSHPWPLRVPSDVGSEGNAGHGVAPDVRARAEEIVGEPLLVAAASLVIERASADAVATLRDAGIRAILLKGPLSRNGSRRGASARVGRRRPARRSRPGRCGRARSSSISATASCRR